MKTDAAHLSEGVSLLARAVQVPSPATKVAGFALTEAPEALAEGEVLIAVADAKSVALKRVKLPGVPRTTSESGAVPRLEELARRLAEIELLATEISQAVAGETAALPALTEQEEDVLRSAGLDAHPLAADETHLLHRATAEYARLLNDSYTVQQAAHALRVNNSRIRQRLTASPRTLYGVKVGRRWHIPRFQFDGRRLVPGIEAVVQRLATDLHPVAVYRWFTSANPDLTRDEDKPISPLDWLRLGNSAEVVAELAAAL